MPATDFRTSGAEKSWARDSHNSTSAGGDIAGAPALTNSLISDEDFGETALRGPPSSNFLIADEEIAARN